MFDAEHRYCSSQLGAASSGELRDHGAPTQASGGIGQVSKCQSIIGSPPANSKSDGIVSFTTARAGRCKALLARLLLPLLLANVPAAVSQGVPTEKRQTLIVTGGDRGHPTPIDATSLRFVCQGHELQFISSETIQSVPLDVAIVLDMSSSQGHVAQLEAEYATSVLRSIRHDNIRVTLISSGSEVATLVQSAPLADALTALAAIAAGTAQPSRAARSRVYEGISEAITLFPDDHATHIVVVFAEGVNEGASAVLHSLERQAASKRVAAFVILVASHDFFGTKSHEEYGWRLRQFSSVLGGETFQTDFQDRKKDAHVLSKAASEISNAQVVTLAVPHGLTPGMCRLKVKSGSSSHARTSPIVVH
jgi:hypothetical protein